MAGLLHRNWPIYRNAQKYQKYSFSNGRLGPKRKAAAGCLNREHAALNIWRESATSNFKKQPKTEPNASYPQLLYSRRRADLINWTPKMASRGRQAVLDTVAGQSSHREGTGELAGNHREFTDSTVRPRTLQSVILVEALDDGNSNFLSQTWCR